MLICCMTKFQNKYELKIPSKENPFEGIIVISAKADLTFV